MIIKNKKAQSSFKASSWIMAVVIFSGIIALFVIQSNAMVTTYDVPNVTSEKFSSNFDKFEENTQTVGEIWNKTSGEGGLSTVGTYEVLFKGTFGVLNLVLSSITLAGSQMFSFSEYFGIPSEVAFIFFTIMFSLLMIAIVFLIISSVSRRDL